MSFSCAICQELVTKHPEGPQEPGSERVQVEIVAVSCGHVFHKSCIETWFTERARECVICKTRVSNDFRKLYPSCTEEGDDVEKLNKQKKDLVVKVSVLESSKKKAEVDLASAKEDGQFNKALLAIAQMELEAMTQSKNDLQEQLNEQFVVSESMKTAAEQEKKQLEENLTTAELKNTEQQAKIIELTHELRDVKSSKLKTEAELTALAQQQRVRESMGVRKPLAGRRAGSEEVHIPEDRPPVTTSTGRLRLPRSATVSTADLAVEVQASPNSNDDVFSSVVSRARGKSMGCQTAPLGVDYALEILDGAVDPLGMCIRILQDEKNFREAAAAERASQNGVNIRKKGPQQASTRPLTTEDHGD